MLQKLLLLLGITSSVVSLHASEANPLLADAHGDSLVALVITSDSTTTLEADPLFNNIVVSNAQEIEEGFVSHQTSLNARSPHPGGYYVDVQTTDEAFVGAEPALNSSHHTFYMVRKGSPGVYRIAFDLLSDKSPQGHPTPIHHEGFGPPEGGTPHGNGSKIINTEGKPDIEKKNYGIHFFILSKQFKFVPHGLYVAELVVNLVET